MIFSVKHSHLEAGRACCAEYCSVLWPVVLDILRIQWPDFGANRPSDEKLGQVVGDEIMSGCLLASDCTNQ